MAKKISSLSVVLGATVKPFVSAFASARGAVGGFLGSIKGAAAGILRFTGIAGGLGALLGGLGFGALVKGQLDAIDVNAKLSDRLGISTESLAGFQHAAGLAGVSSEQLTGGLEFMLKNVAKAATQGGALGEAFTGMGLNAKDLANAAPEEAFAQIADALKAIENPAQRALAATQIFGKSGQQLLPLMMQGADGIKAAMKEADALGLTFNRVDAAKVEEANDAFTRMRSAVTGVFRAITIAIAPFLTSFARTFTALGIKVVATVKAWLPSVISTINRLWHGITTIFNAIYQTVAPIVSGIIDFIARNWRRNVITTTAYLVSIWGVVSSIFTAVWGIISAVGGAIAAAWTWTMNALGVTTSQSGATVGGVFQSMADWGTWLMEQITFAFNVISYSITNWRDTFELAGAEVALFIVRTANEIAHVFTEVIPAVLSWFLDNWKDIFTTIFNFTKSVFVNLAANIGNFAAALWSFLKGDGFNFEFTGLLEGFESTIKQLPAIAQRQAGPLEQALADQANALRDSFGGGLAAHLEKQEKQTARAIEGITGGIAGVIEGFTPPPISGPAIEPPDTSGIEAVGEKAKKSSSELKAMFAGSAEAMQAQAAAGFAAKLESSSMRADTAKLNPDAVPVPATATADMRKGAAQTKTLDESLVQHKRTNQLLGDILEEQGELDLAAAEF